MEQTTIKTTEIAARAAYLIGISENSFHQYYDTQNESLFEKLKQDKEATIIRYLNRIKTALLKHFKSTNNEIVFNLSNLDRLPQWYNTEEIRQLEEWGVNVLLSNAAADRYMLHISYLINTHIGRCRHLFYDWVKFEYIQSLFYTTISSSAHIMEQAMKKEFAKFMGNINMYPFQMYIHWQPKEYGNILSNDYKFLKILYAQHNDCMTDQSKMHDAKEEVKDGIYEFIEKSGKIVIAVDCENSDAFKLYGMLKNLDEEKLSKIKKIMLYDDIHTSTAWEWLGKFIKIPTEYMEIQRISEMKSLVDISMTAGVCAEFYKNGVDSFILCSSDSDFWGLISSLPDADFLVMYEKTKCGQSIMETMTTHQIMNCCIDDFYTGNADELKLKVLKEALRSFLPHIIGMNSMELAKKIYEDTKIRYRQEEINYFYNKYIKTLRMIIDKDGNFKIEINDF